MANFSFTVGELTSQIITEAKMDIAQLGNSAAAQNTYIYFYITEVLWELAADIKKKKTSSPLVVSADGYVTFQISGVNIDDMYAPLRILVTNESGPELTRRATFTSATGWIRESQNDLIHIKGAGTYVLQYIAYPTKATIDSQILDIPSTSYGIVKDRVIARIKESLNDLEGVKQAIDMAGSKVPILTRANIDAKGKKPE